MTDDNKRASCVRRCVIGTTLLALATAWTADLSAAESAPTAQPAVGHPAPAVAPTGKKETDATKPVKLVDINSASRAELKTLPGIGDAEAAKIVAARPYLSKADLATNNVLPTGVYIALKDRIIAKPTGKPAVKK
jgi:DNA uptake protein ComE-like DNA-binding protein